jgi:biotin synthase
MHKSEILGWLRQTDSAALDQLYRTADQVRRETVGDEVHLRGLIEISNICARQCGYCGLRASHANLQRYRMTSEEIMQSALTAEALGFGTVVLQAGESSQAIPASWIASLVDSIKARTRLAVTLSLGERDPAELKLWRDFGADRYLLRFETSDPELYALIHPPLRNAPSDRIALLRVMRKLGYEAGSGVMVGIPGQTYESLADDLLLFADLDLDMIGIGPYIPHPATPLATGEWRHEIPAADQVPNTETIVYKVVALARILRPDANIPSTTALATINTRNGRELGLQRGANVVMPNLTPGRYRKLYEIYPNKACIAEQPADCNGCLHGRIRAIGRVPGQGPGGRRTAAHV